MPSSVRGSLGSGSRGWPGVVSGNCWAAQSASKSATAAPPWRLERDGQPAGAAVLGDGPGRLGARLVCCPVDGADPSPTARARTHPLVGVVRAVGWPGSLPVLGPQVRHVAAAGYDSG